MWVPPVQSSSSTFDLLFASSPRLFAVHSVGFHIQVTLASETSFRTFSNATTQAAIEASVERLLHEVLPTGGFLPAFQKGMALKNWRWCYSVWQKADRSFALCFMDRFPGKESLSLSQLEERRANARSLGLRFSRVALLFVRVLVPCRANSASISTSSIPSHRTIVESGDFACVKC